MLATTTMKPLMATSSTCHAKLTLHNLTWSPAKKASPRFRSTSKFPKLITSSNKMRRWRTSNQMKTMVMKTLWIKWYKMRNETFKCRRCRILSAKMSNKTCIRNKTWTTRWITSSCQIIKIMFLSHLRPRRSILSPALWSRMRHRLIMPRML